MITLSYNKTTGEITDHRPKPIDGKLLTVTSESRTIVNEIVIERLPDKYRTEQPKHFIKQNTND